ncbi:MAG: ATP-binding cassette domain-containing protein [Proteobacteria bacterium]|nr:ATP-binding cassette domain-containing protein [Pseudomonadota bacterium]
MKKCLTIKNLSIGYGNEEILQIDHFDLSTNTVVGLLGPSGCGKSTLFSAILRKKNNPSYWEKGHLLLEGIELDPQMAQSNIELIPQKSRLFTGTILENFLDGVTIKDQQKKDKPPHLTKNFLLIKDLLRELDVWPYFEHILDSKATGQSLGIHKILLIVKAVAKKPILLLLDEVLSNTSIKDEKIIIALIKKLKTLTTICLITHNKEEAQVLCDSIALVSGGVLHEHTEKDQFFKQPSTKLGREFLKSGSAWHFDPNAEAQPKAEDKLTALRRFSSMNEFYWVLPESLGGMQKPGLLTHLNNDLKIMQQLGVNVLVSLMQEPINAVLLNHYDIKGIHFPMVDMSIPKLEPCFEFIAGLDKLFAGNKSIVYHCKAGMGRTGLMLACHLILLEGISAIQAIEKIRQINYKYIQTDEQIDFVATFQLYAQSNRAAVLEV